jgi:hypothetical protein
MIRDPMGSRLSAMFERSGLITASQASAAREYAISQQLGIADAMLDLGLVDHDSIVAFCSSKLLIPRASALILAHVTPDAHGRVPGGLAWKHAVLPISVDGRGNLTLAMLDPTDDDAVRVISEETGCVVIRAAANGAHLRQALTHIYGDPHAAALTIDPNATQPGLPRVPAPSQPKTPEPQAPPRRSETLTFGAPAVPPVRPPPSAPPVSAPSVAPPTVANAPLPPPPVAYPPAAAPTAQSAPPPPSRPPQSWNPPLASRETEPAPLSPEAFELVLPRLERAQTKDEVTHTILGFLAAGFTRTLLFVHTNQELRGHDARGADLLVEAVRMVRIPTGGPSVFAKAIDTRTAFFGPMPLDSTIDRAFANAMGGISGNVLLLPMPISDKVPLLVFAMGASGPVDPRSVTALSREAGEALKRILLAMRRRT